jgi:hypothetical protein
MIILLIAAGLVILWLVAVVIRWWTKPRSRGPSPKTLMKWSGQHNPKTGMSRLEEYNRRILGLPQLNTFEEVRKSRERMRKKQ